MTYFKKTSALLLFILTLTTCSCGGGGGDHSSDINNQGYSLEKVAYGLAFPIRVSELSNSSLIFAELNSGKLKSIDLKTNETKVIESFPPADSNSIGISGLLVDRDYNNNGFIFVYHLDDKSNKNVVSRAVKE